MKQNIKLNESSLRNIITESVKQILSELNWKTVTNAANKSRANLQQMALNHAYNDVDRIGRYATTTGVRPQDRYARMKNGHVDFENERNEFIRKMKQADNLANFADKSIKDHFGSQSYYNNLNGVGNEFPAYRKSKRYYDEEGNYVDDDIVDYFPNSDHAHGDLDDYPLSNMPKSYQEKAKEIDDFQNGKYKYNKKYGEWELKNDLDESLHKIIKKHVNEAMNEDLCSEADECLMLLYNHLKKYHSEDVSEIKKDPQNYSALYFYYTGRMYDLQESLRWLQYERNGKYDAVDINRMTDGRTIKVMSTSAKINFDME